MHWFCKGIRQIFSIAVSFMNAPNPPLFEAKPFLISAAADSLVVLLASHLSKMLPNMFDTVSPPVALKNINDAREQSSEH